MPAPLDPPLLERVPLGPLTSLGLGGPAERWARVCRPEEVPPLLDWASRRELPVTVLGGGTNVVIADAGVAGLVLSVELRGRILLDEQRSHVDVYVGAGEPWDAFVAEGVARGWAGLECLSGIPGRAGATPIQNVGAYGQEVADTLVSVDVYDRAARERRTLPAAECELAYRHSRFKAPGGDRWLVLGATFRLRPGGAPCLAYPEVARRFAGAPTPTPAEVRAAVLETRQRKSMLLDPGDENGRSCGSFFVNPELSATDHAALLARSPEPPPGFIQPDGRVKVPAAWLIERAGFTRGQRFGSIGISSRHALALVCHEGASAAQLVRAARRVRDAVREAFGVQLRAEPRFYGFGSPCDELPGG